MRWILRRDAKTNNQDLDETSRRFALAMQRRLQWPLTIGSREAFEDSEQHTVWKVGTFPNGARQKKRYVSLEYNSPKQRTYEKSNSQYHSNYSITRWLFGQPQLNERKGCYGSQPVWRPSAGGSNGC